jgi:hypothetical protein
MNKKIFFLSILPLFLSTQSFAIISQFLDDEEPTTPPALTRPTATSSTTTSTTTSSTTSSDSAKYYKNHQIVWVDFLKKINILTKGVYSNQTSESLTEIFKLLQSSLFGKTSEYIKKLNLKATTLRENQDTLNAVDKIGNLIFQFVKDNRYSRENIYVLKDSIDRLRTKIQLEINVLESKLGFTKKLLKAPKSEKEQAEFFAKQQNYKLVLGFFKAIGTDLNTLLSQINFDKIVISRKTQQ